MEGRGETGDLKETYRNRVFGTRHLATRAKPDSPFSDEFNSPRYIVVVNPGGAILVQEQDT